MLNAGRLQHCNNIGCVLSPGIRGNFQLSLNWNLSRWKLDAVTMGGNICYLSHTLIIEKRQWEMLSKCFEIFHTTVRGSVRAGTQFSSIAACPRSCSMIVIPIAILCTPMYTIKYSMVIPSRPQRCQQSQSAQRPTSLLPVFASCVRCDAMWWGHNISSCCQRRARHKRES